MKVLYFHKTNCAPCTFTKPAVESATRAKGVLPHYIDCSPGRTLDVDTLITKYEIRSVPTVVVEDAEGLILTKLVGAGINASALTLALDWYNEV